MNTVLITGATSPLGSALCSLYAKLGYRVWALYFRNAEEASKFEAFAKIVSCDLRDSRQSAKLGEMLFKEMPQLDILINNAGLGQSALLKNTEEQELEAILKVNFFALKGLTERLYPLLQKTQGHVLNIASHQSMHGAAGAACYAMSKAAVLGWSQALAAQWGKEGIRVNAIFPGFMLSSMTENLSEKVHYAVIEQNALSRLSSIEEIAQGIVDISLKKHISGQMFNLDSRIQRYCL